MGGRQLEITCRCRECGEDYKPGSPTAKSHSTIGLVDELIYHIDPCSNCCTGSRDKAEIKALSEMVKRREAKLHNIEEGLRRLEIFLMDGMDRTISPINDDGVPMFALCASIEIIKFRAPTLADLIDAILIGGGTGEA